jgi:hypothetical protein
VRLHRIPLPGFVNFSQRRERGQTGNKGKHSGVGYLARRNGAGTPVLCGKFYSFVDRSSTARGAVKLAQTAYTCLLLPTRSSGYGGHGADAVKLAQTA